MLNDKLLEVLSHPADGEVAIVTQGSDGTHVVNTWNSYVFITPDGRMLIPAGRMNQTEKNIAENEHVKLTVGSREVQGLNYKGAGFLITGTAKFKKEGPEYNTIKEKFPWARAVLEVKIVTAVQTLRVSCNLS
jgi:flavin reductase (DIM6/NTAB) family NADH-FMN oxidoreductase RutF